MRYRTQYLHWQQKTKKTKKKNKRNSRKTRENKQPRNEINCRVINAQRPRRATSPLPPFKVWKDKYSSGHRLKRFPEAESREGNCHEPFPSRSFQADWGGFARKRQIRTHGLVPGATHKLRMQVWMFMYVRYLRNRVWTRSIRVIIFDPTCGESFDRGSDETQIAFTSARDASRIERKHFRRKLTQKTGNGRVRVQLTGLRLRHNEPATGNLTLSPR